MIRAKVTERVYLFGLSEENVKRLKQHSPIHFNLTSCGGPDLEIWIVYGRTERELFARFIKDSLIGPETELKGDVPKEVPDGPGSGKV
jgi:hypothetical protein